MVFRGIARKFEPLVIKIFNNMVSSKSGKTYEAPESEVLVFRVERNFLTDSPQSSVVYHGSYNLESGGLQDGHELE